MKKQKPFLIPLLISTIIALFFLLLTSNFAQAQQKTPKLIAYNYYGDSIDIEKFCSYFRFQYNPQNTEAETLIDKILEHVGLKRNFTIRECPDLNNCIATIIDKIPYIIYDKNFLEKIGSYHSSTDKVTITDWAATSILAHEVGHHLNMHTIQFGGSTPELELEADEFSGFVLYSMGATLEQAQSAMNSSMINTKGTSTHPPKTERLIAIKKGWENARGKGKINVKPVPKPEVSISSLSTMERVVIEEKISSIMKVAIKELINRHNFVNRMIIRFATIKRDTQLEDKIKLLPNGEFSFSGIIEVQIKGRPIDETVKYLTKGKANKSQLILTELAIKDAVKPNAKWGYVDKKDLK